MMDEARQAAQRRMIERGRARYRLTVGELFPDGDLVAQWVFSVNALSEDMTVVMRPLRKAVDAGDLRAMLFYDRQLVTRLYEARRIVTAARSLPEVEAFAQPLLTNPPTKLDLNGVYVRDPPDQPSVVEQLYADLRHRTVHYMKVGSDELRDILFKHLGYPAQMAVSRDGETADVWCKWVHAVTAADVFGDVSQPDFIAEMRRRGGVAANIASTWVLVSGLATMMHSRRLGIDLEQLVEPPEPGTEPPSTPA